MKEIYTYYARCNQQINNQMVDLIYQNIKKPYELTLKGYYFKSLGLLLEHIFISDMNWMKEFLGISDYGMNIEVEVGSLPENGNQMFTDFDEYKMKRVSLDNFILNYMNKISEQDLNKNVSRITKSKGKIEKPLWKAIIHFFNHQTHHRGQISNILDDLKIENNYSNMIFID